MFVMLLQTLCSNAQKPPIDSQAIAEWTYVANPSLSNDGRSVAYIINNFPVKSSTLILRSVSDRWEKKIVGASLVCFSDNGNLAVFKRMDSLYFMNLKSGAIQYGVRIKSYKVPSQTLGKLIVYMLPGDKNEVVVHNLNFGAATHFFYCKEYFPDDQGQNIILTKEVVRGDSTLTKVISIDLNKNNETLVWENKHALKMPISIEGISFHSSTKKISFIVREKTADNSVNSSLWFYSSGPSQARCIFRDGYENGFIIGKRIPSLKKNGKWILFSLNKKDDKTVKKIAGVDIWSYNDSEIQSAQRAIDRSSYMAIVSTSDTYKLIREDPNKILQGFQCADDNVIILNRANDAETVSSLNLNNLKQTKLSDEKGRYSISPNGDFVIYYSEKRKSYVSFEIASSRFYNITENIPVSLLFKSSDKDSSMPLREAGIAGWHNDSTILVYDDYDIWLVDARAAIRPVNVTKGFGRINNIKFRIVENTIRDKQLILSSFQTRTKENGFFKLNLKDDENPHLLSKGSESVYRIAKSNVGSLSEFNAPLEPIKAKKAMIWLVQKAKVENAPNYYLTSDFISFKQISNVQPQQTYNWIRSDLIKWPLADGTLIYGILYSPENFDSSKQYPVIFHYYEQMSDRVFEFPKPEFSTGELNIPWMVSRGYLVFTPDIKYSIGYPGKSVLESILRAVSRLSTLPFIDSNRMGLQGFSFGGFETNYIIANTNRFAAAVSGGGQSDFISGYGSIAGYNDILMPRNQVFESGGQSRIGATLWERPDLFLENSAVLNAHKVETPLLLMHNKGDGNVPWQQSVEFYMAFRRLHKRNWLLQYDGEGHVLEENSFAAIDYTIRMTQFFDHYLKSAPAPIWMTQGIPAKLKGIITGYDLDPSGACGKDCKICKMWNEKMKRDSINTMIEIREKAKKENWMIDGIGNR